MKPTVVLVPGLLCTADLYKSQIQFLEKEYSVIVADHTQHERMEDIATSILERVDGVFSLAGLSMGGYICMEIMRQAPHRVERLMLLDTSSRPDTPEQTQRRRDFIKLSSQGRFKGVTPQMMSMLVHEDHLENEGVTQTVYDMALEIGREGFVRQQTAIIARPDSRPFLSQISCPTFIVCGTDDQLTPPPLAAEMHGLIANSNLHLVERAGHLTPLEKPEEINLIFERWLKVA